MKTRLITLRFNLPHFLLFTTLTWVGAITLAVMGIYQWWCWIALMGWLWGSYWQVLPAFKQASQAYLWLMIVDHQPVLSIADLSKQPFKKMCYDKPFTLSMSPLWIYIASSFENPQTNQIERKTLFILRGSTSELKFRAITLYLLKIKKSLLKKNKKSRLH